MLGFDREIVGSLDIPGHGMYVWDGMSFYLDARATRSSRLVQENKDMVKIPKKRDLESVQSRNNQEKKKAQLVQMENRTKEARCLSLPQTKSMEYPGRTGKRRRNTWSLNKSGACRSLLSASLRHQQKDRRW